MSQHALHGRYLCIATRHSKELSIQPLLESAWGVRCVVPPNLDTDSLGTFSGEVARPGDISTTLRAKCQLGATASGYSLVLASEGSYGPHPNIPFIPAAIEHLMLKDYDNDLEIVVQCLSTDTNFAGLAPRNLSELSEFTERVGFPAHALVVRNAAHRTDFLAKGIHSHTDLKAAIDTCQNDWGTYWVETDMRAMHNPTRMRLIGDLTQQLIEAYASACPSCNRPGFQVQRSSAGLPCAWCGQPTGSVRFHHWVCTSCGHEKLQEFPKGKTTEDPMYCNHCNP